MATSQSPSTGTTVLVVDDEPSICWGFQQLLGQQGHEVLTASSAEEGLKLARDQEVSLVLLDVRLPGEDGLSALPKFRQATGEAPVIVMTAFGDLETAVAAILWRRLRLPDQAVSAGGRISYLSTGAAPFAVGRRGAGNSACIRTR